MPVLPIVGHFKNKQLEKMYYYSLKMFFNSITYYTKLGEPASLHANNLSTTRPVASPSL